MKIVGVLNEKGGVGKTTLAITVSAGMARRGYKVVVVDCDPQGHGAQYLGMEQEAGLFNLLVGQTPIARLLRQVPQDRWLGDHETSDGQFGLLAGNSRTTTAGHTLTAEQAPLDTLLKALQPLQGVDVIVLDTSPTISLLLAMIYYTADMVLIPTQAESLSMNGVYRASQRIRATADRTKKPVRLMGVVPTMYRGQTLEHQENLNELRLDYGDKLWEPITQSTIWPETVAYSRTIFAYAPRHSATQTANLIVDRFEEALFPSNGGDNG